MRSARAKRLRSERIDQLRVPAIPGHHDLSITGLNIANDSILPSRGGKRKTVIEPRCTGVEDLRFNLKEPDEFVVLWDGFHDV